MQRNKCHLKRAVVQIPEDSTIILPMGGNRPKAFTHALGILSRITTTGHHHNIHSLYLRPHPPRRSATNGDPSEEKGDNLAQRQDLLHQMQVQTAVPQAAQRSEERSSENGWQKPKPLSQGFNDQRCNEREKLEKQANCRNRHQKKQSKRMAQQTWEVRCEDSVQSLR